MNQQHLESLIVVADFGSISAAAKSLYLNPASLHQQMKLLEKEVGFDVFIRSPKGVELTPAGQNLYKHAKSILADTNSMLNECREIAHQEQQTIRIALFPPYKLMKQCHAFSDNHPEVHFEYATLGAVPVTHDLLEHVSSGIYDIAEYGYVENIDDDNLGIIKVKAWRVCAICEPSHPLAAQQSVSVEDLAHYHVAMCKTMSDPFLDVVEQAHKRGANLEFDKVFYEDDTVLKCCAQGHVFLGTDQQANVFEHLACIPLEPEVPYYSCLVYRKHAKPAVQALIESIQEHDAS